MVRVYIETSIVSYLRQRPSAQIVAAARQVLTQRWWDEERAKYEIVTSQYVLDEAAGGDPHFAQARLESLAELPLLQLGPEIDAIAAQIIGRAILPANAQLDALHIATAAHHRIDYLLTWNCTHIANARILPRIRRTLVELNSFVPIICTPEEMVDDVEPENESQ